MKRESEWGRVEGAGEGEVGVSVIPDAQVLTGFLFFSGEVRTQKKFVREIITNYLGFFLLGFLFI